MPPFFPKKPGRPAMGDDGGMLMKGRISVNGRISMKGGISMKVIAVTAASLSSLLQIAAAAPGAVPSAPLIAALKPLDRDYPGEIQLSVDASDVGRRIVRVH